MTTNIFGVSTSPQTSCPCDVVSGKTLTRCKGKPQSNGYCPAHHHVAPIMQIGRMLGYVSLDITEHLFIVSHKGSWQSYAERVKVSRLGAFCAAVRVRAAHRRDKEEIMNLVAQLEKHARQAA